MTDLASLTTLGIGGPAARLVQPATRAELIDETLAVWNSPEDWLLLGGGSNVVIADDGFDGDVIRVATRGIGVTRAEGSRPVRLTVEAGEPWDDVVVHAVEAGWSGIEALSGIPGSAGAAPVQNIGAYGQELSSSLVAIDFLDFDTGKLVRVAAAELGLGYRTSALKRGRLGLVVSLELALADDPSSSSGRGLSQPIAYAQLASALDVRIGDRVPVSELRAAVLELRGAKGMLWDPADPDSASAGSFFTNPVVTEQFARGLPADAPRWPTAPEEAARVLPLGSEIPHIVRGEYLVKLSAAWLIEKAGITRGFALPGSRAAVSSKHTLAIVNRGGATAADVVQLAGYIQTRVLAEFGVNLQPEPVLVGVSL
ncbi:UDP-N-acetylmuramate dehydrogenase [Pseudolysinimonas yzui]|uniref:UDP-N-acetylenolpyruvoylglucosamine reductase n=1 Tax=Pseudolysinimonas yzui TaxID=2708254 RepID=A0A8J3GQ52_9MICO|nr:UDP-N-acetylmuramate dehydrogenase [Pseudolysinimonas yzui]GHF13841.1 UDP-N-acetylenolpyruvoylglucosamine reductase [Pseudolysinimonas yzui]